MLSENKVCDGADWFDSDFQDVAVNKYKALGWFHRKQWEFIKIYLTLQTRGLLNQETKCLSLGTGTEALMYPLINRVKEFHATDLYNTSTNWKGANTGGTPKDFIMKAKEVDHPDRLFAKNMDMRNITYEDDMFDFAYSSCAVEHIGLHHDFVKHFSEIYRVLKPGGIYVFTTEFGFMKNSVKIPHHWCFGMDEISELINGSKFNINPEIDCTLFKHRVNSPTHISKVARNKIPALPNLTVMYPHIILWPAHSKSHCFTSTCFVLIKEPRKGKFKLNFKNMDESIEFLKQFKA